MRSTAPGRALPPTRAGRAPMAYTETNRGTNRPISAIFVDLVNQFTTLLRKEGQLARAEMGEKLGEIGIGLGLIVGGAVLLIPALVFLLKLALAAWLPPDLAAGWPSLPAAGPALL